jgi:GrpB-like predicted nucleotidyltransferase (UPF0157 family)
MTDTVIVVPYDPGWPSRFERERALLGAVFGERDAAVEHVGSTAVPGLGAKPVIDIMVGVAMLTDAEDRIAALEAAGYEYVPCYESQLPERRYFRKPRLGPRAYHLHCVVKESDFWVRHLAFRDYLRAHSDVAAGYYELKCDLAASCGKGDYTDAKGPFIEGVLAHALGERRTDIERPGRARV